MRRRGWVMAGLLLTACSAEQKTVDYNAAGAVDPRQAKAQEKIEAAAGKEGADRAMRSGLPVDVPTPGASGRHLLPAAYQGYWGITPGDCELINYEAPGRAVVEGDKVRFHDARARIVSLTEHTPNNFDMVLRFEGPGEDRTSDAKIGLRDGGTHLEAVVTTPGQAAARTIRYERC